MVDRIKILDNPLLKEGVVNKSQRKCQICEKVCHNVNIARHLKECHSLTPEQYVLHLLGLTEVPGCAICDKDLSKRFLSISRGFPDTCSRRCSLKMPGRIDALSNMMKDRFKDEEYLKRHAEWSSKTMSSMNRGEIHPHFKENKNAVVWGANGEVNRERARVNMKEYLESFRGRLTTALGRFDGDSPVTLYLFRAGGFIKVGVSRSPDSRRSKFECLGETGFLRTIELPKYEACLSEQTILRLTEEHNPNLKLGLWGESELRKPDCLSYVLDLFDEVEREGVLTRGFENEGK